MDLNNVTYSSATNPRYTSEDGSMIDLDVVFDHLGDESVPFTATSFDEFPHGRELHARALAGDFGPIAPYVAPPPVVPESVTRRQGRLALIDAGKLLDVEAAIAAIADPVEKMKAQVEYDADTWERSNAFLVSMWLQLGGTEQELDDLFILAATK